MQIGPRSCVFALAVTSALAGFASPAAAVPANTSGQTAAAPKPIPAASWHGRPIRRPDRAGIAVMAAGRAATAPALAFGAGYGRPGGSARVKEVQRLLLRIGYRCGTVDGMFGPLTRASVQWFQIKHSLRPTGAADARTLELLRLRSHGATPSPTTEGPQPTAPAAQPVAGHRPAVRTPAPAPPAAAAPGPVGRTRTHGSGGWAAPAVIVLVLAALALLAVTLLRLRRRRRGAAPPTSEPPRAPKAVVGRAEIVAATTTKRAVGYVAGRHPRDLRHQAHAIERACAKRGWALAKVVREQRAGNGHRPGLRFALEQLADGTGGRLVACRLDDVGRTRDELAGLLGWCARSGVDLVALDVGLDTGTRHGRLVARSLVARGKRGWAGRALRSPAFLRRRRAEAAAVDGELAPSQAR